jgi:outer membrane biosynthesis protein TonB
MAKKDKPLSFSDFEADNSLIDNEEEEIVPPVDEEEEEDQDEPPVEKKVQKKPVKKVAAKAPPVEEEEEEEEEVVPPAPEEEEEEDDQPDPEASLKFFEEVDKITGQAVDVDYGDIDPLTPQGVALREKAVREAALDSWLEEIEERFPQVYRALVHANNGGNVAELFTQTTSRDYSKVVLKEGDDTVAKEILRDYYKSKGVKNEDKLRKLIETDEDSENGLIAEAQSALEELQAEQEEQKVAIIEEQRKKADEQKKKDQILITAIDDVLESRQLHSFKIPDRVEANQFRKFLMDNVRRTGEGKYELATPLDQSNLETILQYQYFQFKKGDLSKIIQQKAVTEQAKKLKLKLRSEQDKTKKNTEEEGRTGKLSLRDF